MYRFHYAAYIVLVLILPEFQFSYTQVWILPYHNHFPSIGKSEPLIQIAYPFAKSGINQPKVEIM